MRILALSEQVWALRWASSLGDEWFGTPEDESPSDPTEGAPVAI